MPNLSELSASPDYPSPIARKIEHILQKYVRFYFARTAEIAVG